MPKRRPARSAQASSAIDYQLHTLGWKGFQDLCGSILGVVLGQTYQTFADSSDGGRDGAFYGVWRRVHRETLRGSFTVQCKHTVRRNQSLSVSSLKDELKKAHNLAQQGLAENYLLLTNFTLTGAAEQRVRKAFLAIDGVHHFVAYGQDWVTRQIHENAPLRMLVPKVYGLGDLSQLLDERAYDQAQELLSTMGDDLAKFVVTDAYRKSAGALADHGFVLLVGEPASGKSTIAAALALSANDRWECSTIWATGPDDIRTHWNPHEPRQLFWVDDAFGATQLDWSRVESWNRVFPLLNAAVRKGARVLMTSRDYVYRAAADFLKASSFPLLEHAQVLVEVEKLSQPEREQILYNHIRRGRQPKAFRAAIKPILPEVAAHKNFKPEAARRLGDPLFTTKLSLNRADVLAFVSRPMLHLLEVLRSLDDASRAALAVVFMRNGVLPSPMDLSPEEREAATLLGGTPAEIRKALRALDGTLVLKVLEGGSYKWKFKHPTIRDALAELVASDSELLGVYLSGTPTDRLVNEVSCGKVSMRGVKVVVPRRHYDQVASKLAALVDGGWDERRALCAFLINRCRKQFLQHFLKKHKGFLDALHVGSYVSAVPDVRLMARLHELGLLPESVRRRAVQAMTELAVNTPDAGFLQEPYVTLFGEDEKTIALIKVANELLPRLEQVVEDWKDDYSYNDESTPEEYFDALDRALILYGREFPAGSESAADIEHAQDLIQDAVAELEQDREDASGRNEFDSEQESEGDASSGRSVFDDVDA